MVYVNKHVFTKRQKVYLELKRCIDFIMAVLGLIMVSPILLLSILWIKVESPGPAIFKQRRPGFHQEIFTIYKLRSMRIETIDKSGKALTDQERMTKSGNFVRKTSIDELPQLVNIIKGEMSFIGPRPFLINDLDSYNEEQKIRFEVLPGITSWTAIHGRNNQTIQDKYNQEIVYVNRIGFKIDAEIFLKTIALVFLQNDVEDHTNDGRIAAEIMDDKKENVS